MRLVAVALAALLSSGCATLDELGTDFGDVVFDRDAAERVQVRYDAWLDAGDDLVDQIKAEIDSPAVALAIGELIQAALGRITGPLGELLDGLAAAPPEERERYVARILQHLEQGG